MPLLSHLASIFPPNLFHTALNLLYWHQWTSPVQISDLPSSELMSIFRRLCLTQEPIRPNLLNFKNKQEVLRRTNRLLFLIRHGTHWKRRVQQFFYCCVCICYLVYVSTEPLPSNDRGIFTEPLPINDRGIYTQPLPSNDRGIHIQTHRRIGGIFSLLSLFWKKLSRLTRSRCCPCVSLYPPHRC
jgi:hypothetical protein